jgi:hypothetical protein
MGYPWTAYFDQDGNQCDEMLAQLLGEYKLSVDF